MATRSEMTQGSGTCSQASWSEFDPWNQLGGREELTLRNDPLTTVYMHSLAREHAHKQV